MARCLVAAFVDEVFRVDHVDLLLGVEEYRVADYFGAVILLWLAGDVARAVSGSVGDGALTSMTRTRWLKSKVTGCILPRSPVRA